MNALRLHDGPAMRTRLRLARDSSRRALSSSAPQAPPPSSPAPDPDPAFLAHLEEVELLHILRCRDDDPATRTRLHTRLDRAGRHPWDLPPSAPTK